MDDNIAHDTHEVTEADQSLPMESQTETNSNQPIPEFDPMFFGGFDGFKNILSDDLEPIPGAPTVNCRKAHPLRLKRKPKMRKPFPIPKFPPLPDWDVEPYMLESFPEKIDWSKQYYQEMEETKDTIKPHLITWDYVPPYDSEFADEFDRIAETTPDKFATGKQSVSDFRKLPKFYHEEKQLDENDFLDLLDQKDRHIRFQEWLENTETNKKNELVDVPFDGDWQQDQGKEWEMEEKSYGYGEWGDVDAGYDEKDVGITVDQEAEGEGAKFADQEEAGYARRGGGGGGWNRGSGGVSHGWGRGRGFGQGGERGRGFGQGGEWGRGFGQGGERGRGFGQGGDRGRGFGHGGERGRGFRGGFRGRGYFRGGDNTRGYSRGRGGRGGREDTDDCIDFKMPKGLASLIK